MKLLFDHNLSHKLCHNLADLFPDSTQTRLLSLQTAPDQVVWEYAKSSGFILVTLDKDFSDLAMLRGAPPKIIWMRCGNATVAEIERLIRSNFSEIENFNSSSVATVLEIWP
jgi:predicted nuclease of predicted toxin-antitoxin system